MDNSKNQKKDISPVFMNIRVSWDGYSTIKKYATENNLKLGAFVESTVLEKIKKQKKLRNGK